MLITDAKNVGGGAPFRQSQRHVQFGGGAARRDRLRALIQRSNTVALRGKNMKGLVGGLLVGGPVSWGLLLEEIRYCMIA